MDKKLRKKAETLLDGKKPPSSLVQSANLSELLNELRVYQTELEIQNEEMRNTQYELIEAREKYFDLYHFAPVGYFTLDRNGVILELNLQAAGLLNQQRSSLVNKPLSLYLTSDSNYIFSRHRHHVLATNMQQTCELALKISDAQIYVQMESVVIQNKTSDAVCLHSTITNISRRKQAEAALQQAHQELEHRIEKRTADLREEIARHQQTESALQASEKRYKHLLSSVTDYIYTVTVVEGTPTKTYHGPNCMAVTGYSCQEYEDDPDLWYKMVHEEDRPAVTAQAERLLSGELTPPLEHRLVHKDGSIRWVRHTPVVRTDAEGKVMAYEGLITDISGRKRLEEQLAAIQSVGRELTLLRNEEAIISRVLETMANIFQCDGAGYGLLNELTGKIECCYHPLSDRARQAGLFPAPFSGWEARSRLVRGEMLRFVPSAQPDLADCPCSLNRADTAELSAPIKIGDKSIGILNVVDLNPNHFSVYDRKLLQTLADQTAVAIENARLYREIQQRAEAEHTAHQQADMLREATAALTSTIDLNEVLENILIHLERVVPYNGACVFLWDDDCLRVVSGRGNLIQDKVRGQRYSIDGMAHQETELAGHPFTLINSLMGLGCNDYSPGWMSVPLTVRAEVIGYLTLDSQDTGRYSRAEETLAQAFANQAAVAIHNARLFEEVRSGHKQLQFLSRRLVEVQESERRQIARELHDETGQMLTGLIVGLRLLERENSLSEAAQTRLAELEQTTDAVSENLHRLAMNLRPASLDHLGLVAALRQYIKNFSAKYNLPTQFETVGFEDKRPPSTVETNIYRIVQEALTNIIRHAQADRVDVVLKWQDGRLITIIEDDGIGLDAESANRSERLGLVGMRERAEMLGGSLTIEGAAGVGTTILVEVPNVHSDSDR